MKYFKAKIPFSSGTGIYNPSDKNPNKANAAMVDSWAKAGYCEIIEGYEELQKQQPLQEAQNGPNEPIKDEALQLTKEDKLEPETPKNEPKNSAFDTMNYPQLKKAAKQAGIKNYQSMKQVDLIKALKGE